jgi:beta-N-acetylhexosaminidase
MNHLRKLAGQVLWIGFEADAWDGQMESLLRAVRPGGAIFFQRNIRAAEQFRNLVRRIAGSLFESSGIPPFLAVDLEGGLVDRFRELLAPLPSVRQAVRAGMARELGRIAGREVASFFLNVDFAPVLDVGSPESEAVLGTRTAGESPAEVARLGEEFLAGLADSGILGCGKHFPGLGSGCLDSHLAMPRIEKAAAELWEQDLFPFRALASRLPMVMVAHAAYPALEAEASGRKTPPQSLPASLSRRIVSELLKRRIGYEGLVLSDDLEMGGVLEGRTVGEAAVAAIEAGCDMLLVCRRAEYVHAAFEAIVHRAEQDAPFRAAVEKATQKVIHARQQLPQPLSRGLPDSDRLRAEIRRLTAEMELAEENQRRLPTEARKGPKV